ncbi:leucine-rich PPR motif-containing protein, mitochondrial [Drosophila pseudoobscura]|uniref:Leucine-rich PPR motif-containing protein, mitochondrial n=1 Tax=Drosophila pseudoobscura pseudoobscura TaxID=46245 RepID=A0A6I8UH44_DROPS|nr:leucine-rich PPR motif-containing protein, mitochondrial [Drosophila pseudoobscura]
MQRTRLLQSVWVRLTRLGQLPAGVLPTTSHGLRYATNPSLTLAGTPLHHLQPRCLSSSSSSCSADKGGGRNMRPSGSTAPISTEGLWTQLEAYYQQHSLLNYEQCRRLLENLQNTRAAEGLGLSATQLHFLLGSCVPELLPAQSAQERLQLFQSLWIQLLKQGQPTLAHYHTQLEVLRQNRLPLADHRALLAEIGVYHGTADASFYSILLDVACSAGNMRQATELLAEMREKNFPLTEANFHALLLGHGRSKDLPGVESVLSSMRAAGISLSASTQAIRFAAFVENDEVAKARDLLQVHSGFTAPQLLQMLRVTLYSQSVDNDLVQQLVKELPKDYLTGFDVPPALNSLCIELVHQGQAQLAIRLVAALPTPTFNGNQNVDEYAALILQEFFRAHVPIEETLQFAHELSQRGQNQRALHLVTELALRRLPAVALRCFEALCAAGEELRPHYFWPLILHQHRRNGESGMLRLVSEMKRLRVECDEDTLRQYLLPNLVQTLQEPLQALQQLESVGIKPSQVVVHVITQLLQQHQQLPEILDLLQRYPTRLQLSSLLQPLSALSVHARATKRFELFAQLVQALQLRSLQKEEDFVGALLLQMCGPQMRLRQDATSLLKFVHELRRLELQMSPAAAEALLSIARQGTEDNQVLQALGKTIQKMRNAKLTLPADSAAHGGFIKHPRDMSQDELECHLIELESKKLNTRGVLRRLLQLSVRNGRLERAQQLLVKCQALNVQTSAGMLASIFDLHIKQRDLARAQQSLENLQSTYPGFLIDEHKLIDFAGLLVHGGQLEAAKQVLQRRADEHKVIGGTYVIKNVWQLLTNVAQMAADTNQQEAGGVAGAPAAASAGRNLTQETLDFLRQLGYCQVHNALLGPVLREWLLRGDLDAAVAEFQRLASQHKHTPLQFELLSLLVRLGNGNAEDLARFKGTTAGSAQQHLAAVTATVSRVHGAANMNSALLLALAESGTETQLRRLIINPEFRINHDLLIKNCEHLGQEGAVRTLLRLARGVRGVQRSIDEQRIYDMLLSQFSKSNNYEAALDLFERLEADDELKVSQEFIRNLVKLLQLNNVEIPSGIALRAQIR